MPYNEAMLKNILKIIALFIIGMGGGIFADQIFWPYIVERPLFFAYRLDQAPVYVTERKEITIQENTALQDAVEKVEKAVVGIQTKTQAGRVFRGSGLVITSDGLIVTLNELIPQGKNFVFFVDGDTPSYQVLKRDTKANLALIKLEAERLPTLGFGDTSKLRLGQRVFLVGAVLGQDGLQKIVNEGIIRTIGNDSISTTIFEKSILAGSPLFSIEGEVIGLNVIDKEGQVSAISIDVVRAFSGL